MYPSNENIISLNLVLIPILRFLENKNIKIIFITKREFSAV